MSHPQVHLSPLTEIRDAIARYPATLPVFRRHRLDRCCAGAHSIATAALARGLDPEEIMNELRHAAGGDYEQ